MEKLELKYLAPYLPYGLKSANVYVKQYGLTKPLIEDVVASNIMKYTDGSSDAKPILRPLSEIKNFEDIMDEFSEYSWEMFENAFFVLGRTLNCFDSITYTIAELCFKHHIDIFGLIDKGLAISYSDVQSTSNEG